MTGKIGSFLQSLDQFGALSQVSFFNNDVKFKTVYGGILSFIISSLGVSYFVYLMYMWRTYQLPPTVTNQLLSYQGTRYLNLSDPLFILQLEADSQYRNGNETGGEIFDVVTRASQNGDPMTQNQGGFNCSRNYGDDEYQFDPSCLNLDDIRQTIIAQNSQNRSLDQTLSMQISQCNPSKPDNNCLNPLDRGLALNDQQSTWRLTLMTQDADLTTGAITNIPSDYYFLAYNYQLKFQSWNFQLKVKKTTYIIDDGLFFAKEKQVELWRSIQLINIPEQLVNQISEFPIYAQIDISLDKQEEIIRVVHPKLGQVLAEMGSILQLLLFFGIVMNRYNSHLMDLKVEDLLFKIYFPKLKKYNFNYNFRGMLQSVFFNGQLMAKTDQQDVVKFKNTLRYEVRQKLNYLNILKDISKLQINLQMQLPRQKIIELQDLGYRIKTQASNFENKLSVKVDSGLDYEDFLLANKLDITNEKLLLTFGDELSYIENLNELRPEYQT